ncbi:HCP-like protein [Venturia nashicola]|uniref:HCP-like protein n=1 Tax=Venturia nashicola TaxID=86259 RepID=A0A4Z1P6G0_9PEZI|nr:HCP-like protein [Venturia nashicola]TLD26301.1 HCP-like protein [Venturia nashicola]
MTLKDLMKKKDKIEAEPSSAQHLATPAFTFIRTTTNTQEVIDPPTFPGDQPTNPPQRSLSHRFRLRRQTSAAQLGDQHEKLDVRPKNERRLSERLHLGPRDRAASTSSVNIPADLPEIAGDGEDVWEKRATLLAKSNPNTPDEGKKSSEAPVVDKSGDINIQAAINLHEAGEFTKASEMFGQLADPHGANNALSQVLYGLALRHGWGIPKDEARAVTYLSYAASNSADIEAPALQAGMKKGGAAKGELTLAIFELANCFRNGWGVQKDPVAAKQYYETAANMGDTDAMNEAARCYLEGFGCKKDKTE